MRFKHQAQIIKVARMNQNLTQQEFAEKLGFENQFISNIERELAGIPAKHWKKVAQMVGKENLLKALLNDLRDEFKEETK